MFPAYIKSKKPRMTRLLLLAAVLLACLTWPCSAEATPETKPTAKVLTKEEQEEDKTWEKMVAEMKRIRRGYYTPKPGPIVFFASDIMETLNIVAATRYEFKLAKSAGNFFNSSDPKSSEPLNATAEVLKYRARAETAVKSLNATKAGDSTVVKMAAEVAQELYDTDTAARLLTEEHREWFEKRYKNATAQELKMNDAIIKMHNVSHNYPGMHPLIVAVLNPARIIYALSQDAINDVKYVARKLVFTEMMAARIESLNEFVNAEKTADTSCTGATATDDATEVSKQREAAAKAYLSAASAQKIAASCVDRIKGNITQFDKTYYELRQLLAKIRASDYSEMYAVQRMADEAHADAKECEQIAAGTPENAKSFVETAKAQLDGITSCVNATEAKWRAGEAQKASKKALDEMQYALYQLARVTVSVHQVADAKKTVADSKALVEANQEEDKFSKLSEESKSEAAKTAKQAQESTETGGLKGRRMRKEKTENETIVENAAVRVAKKKAVESEKEAETAYDTVKAHANVAANTVHHVADIVKQMKELEAQVQKVDDTDKKKKIKEQLTKAETALQNANQSSNEVQAAAAAVYINYNNTKNVVDSALHWFHEPMVNDLEKNATKAAATTKASLSEEEKKAKTALDGVMQQKAEALAAYNEMSKLVKEIERERGFSTLGLKTERAIERDSATVSSLLHVAVAVLCVMAVMMLRAV